VNDWGNFDGQIMPFGKYRGETIAWIVDKDPDYAEWVVENIEAENVVIAFVEVMERRQRGLR
jgi:uncharacterized protein (DUF3820 family)